MVYYKPNFTILNTKQQAKILIKAVIQYHNLPNSIIINQKVLFTLKF